MQKKKKFKYFFKMAAIAAILDFGPSPKSNGMILGPYLIPPPSFVEIRRGVFPEYCSQTKKQTNKQKGVKTVTSIHLRWRRLKRNAFLDVMFVFFFCSLRTTTTNHTATNGSANNSTTNGEAIILPEVHRVESDILR